MPTIDEFFSGRDLSREIFKTLRSVINELGPAEIQVSKSQVAFVHHKTFALAWMPAQYLHREAAPLVLTLSFRYRDSSPRWKEIVEPVPGRFTHHLELYAPADVDDEVRALLKAARAAVEHAGEDH